MIENIKYKKKLYALIVRKKFWLFPIMAMFITIGGLLVLTQATAVAPFIYTVF